MLYPQSRRYLFDILRPSSGFEFDCAIGTTYSLDLMTLLTTPLAFAVFGWMADESPQNALRSPVALLESLRRYAGHINVFCQAGQVNVSPHHHLYAFIEDSVIEVMPPVRQGAFHPKVWVLRYTAISSNSARIRYRVLCLSRNLTFDRSWDTALVLEGNLTERREPVERNAPLCDFVGRLPSLAVQGARASAVQRCNSLADELRFVEFELPEGFVDLEFLPLGLSSGRSWPFPSRMDRICVASPFVERSTLEKLSGAAERADLISRVDELLRIPEDVRNQFAGIYVLSDAEAINGGEAPPDNDIDVPDESTEHALRGLHAKLYVAESGDDVHVWTGSANATAAAFSQNVEFLVRLQSRKDAHSIDRFLGTDSKEREEAGLINLLEPFAPGDLDESDRIQRMLDKVLGLVRRNLAKTPLVGQVSEDERSGLYTMVLHFEGEITVQSDTSVTCRPLSRHPDDAIRIPTTLARGKKFRFPNMTFEALTPFVAFRMTTVLEGVKAETGFVLRAKLTGLPENRLNRLLGVVLSNREQVLRLIMLLLADDESLSSLWPVLALDGGNHGEGRRTDSPFPLFETMVRASSSDPSRLDTVADLIDELGKIPETRTLLPEHLEEIWDPIWRVRQIISAERHDEPD